MYKSAQNFNNLNVKDKGESINTTEKSFMNGNKSCPEFNSTFYKAKDKFYDLKRQKTPDSLYNRSN